MSRNGPGWPAVLFLAALLIMAINQIGKVHRHLHVLECITIGHVTDWDLSEYADPEATCEIVRDDDTHN